VGNNQQLPPAEAFRSLFESAPALFMVLDPELNIVGVSDEYLKATMTRRSDVLGHGLFEVFPDNPDDPNADGVRNLHASLQRVLKEKVRDTMAVQKYDIRRPESEGGGFEIRYWSPLNSPVFDENGNISYIIHRAEDVTEYYERSEEMEREIVMRSQELQHTNDKLRTTNDALEVAAAAKSDFLSRMSHELRTPMTAILGFGQLLQMQDLDPESKEWTGLMLKAADHLLQLLDDVLDISRLETGNLSMSVEPVPVGTVVNEAFGLIRPLVERYGVTLNESIGETLHYYVLADRQRLRQVLINFLSNAAKYNRPGGTVSVSVDKVDSKHIRVSVSDTGRGLSEESVKKLFRPFERLDAQQSGIEGIGLGLALSRNLVDRMGGEIGVESVPGEGSTFWFEFPSVEPASLKEPTAAETIIDVRDYDGPKTVLYVEDTAANVRLVQEIFKRRPGITFLSVMTGGTALDMAREHQPDLLLLDLHLPDIGGDEVLRRLQADEATKHIPVVILSADATHDQPDRLIAAGARTYLTKPIEITKLLEVTDHVLDEQPSGATSGD
jgi:PAS domain S-box-containing protein